MAISEKDIKLLWGRSASLCALERCKLTQDKESVCESFVLGYQAHIVGENETAARGISTLTKNERNTYSNLILLCGTHHTLIDKNPEDYPVEKLQFLKRKHEEWVQETLGHNDDSRDLANQLIYAHLIDLTVEKADLRSWYNWSSLALSADPRWYKALPMQLEEYSYFIESAVWPGKLPELEAAIQCFAKTLKDASKTFMNNNARWDDELLGPDKFHKKRSFSTQSRFDSAEAKYHDWLDNCVLTMWEVTRAANWFADIVRRDVNPLFFAFEGRFSIYNSPEIDKNDPSRMHVLEFSTEQKNDWMKRFNLTRITPNRL